MHLFILLPGGSASFLPTTVQFLLIVGRHDTGSSRVHLAFQRQWLGVGLHFPTSAIYTSPKRLCFSILGPNVHAYRYGVGGFRLVTLAELHSWSGGSIVVPGGAER